jgi:hypothetical protein
MQCADYENSVRDAEAKEWFSVVQRKRPICQMDETATVLLPIYHRYNLFVLSLLFFIIVRFRRAANPTPT